MKKSYFLLFFVFTFFANAQIVNIPDANFKSALLSASSDSGIASTETPIYDSTDYSWTVLSNHTIDINGDGEIQVSEAENIKWLSCPSFSISDCTGIEAFINLEYLSIASNQISNLNVKNLSNLQALICSNNQLLSLDTSGLQNLKLIRSNSNQLTNINVVGCINLEILEVVDNNISTIDITSLISLNGMYCTDNNLVSLDVTENINLNKLECNYNQISNLDLTQCPDLYYIDCSYNNINNLNVSQKNDLEFLFCSNNQLSSLIVNNNPSLRFLRCQYNQLTNLDVSQCLSLYSLGCDYNGLLSLDISQNTELVSLNCENNQLTELNIKNGLPTFADWCYFSNNPNLEYICCNDQDLLIVQQKINYYGYTSTCHVNSYCSFTPGGTLYEITGNTKLDSNANGCNATDVDYPNLNFSITDGTNTGSFIANLTGEYYIPVQAGIHTITPNLENPTYFNISPTSITVDFPTQESPFIQDFCVTANGVHHDVDITLIPITSARPGFDASYKLVYKNIGNQIENGTVTFTYFQEDALDFVSATPVFDNQNTTGNTSMYTWNYTNLLPFETREINVTINLNGPMETPPLNAGNILYIQAEATTINNDENLSDNFAGIRQNVVNSYDPNDKTCLEGEIVEPSMVGEYVHYMIRFENTGTYPAENIVVKDMIDTSKFDISTLVPLHGSHEFYTRINDNKIEFIFENINLDFNDATNDGYVVFKIKTLPTLTVGNTFSNNANIYFDYNFPITTNTYTTTIQALATPSFTFENEFVLYPNPVNSALSIKVKNQMNVQSVEIYNLVGKLVIVVPNATQTIDVSNLETGTYFIKVNTEKGNAISKFVKE